MRRTIIISDAHLEVGEEQHASYKLVKKYIKAVQPDNIILNGDMLDLSAISIFNKDKPGLREGKRLTADIKMLRKELDFMEGNSKKVQYFEGNHEFRLQVLIEGYPVFTDGIISLPELLNIDYFIPEKQQPIQIIPDLYCMHGDIATMYSAAAVLRKYSCNMIFGHSHRIGEHTSHSIDKESTAWNSGCLSTLNPSYTKNRFTNWSNGFIIVDYDKQGFTVNNIHIRDGSFIIDGRKWK